MEEISEKLEDYYSEFKKDEKYKQLLRELEMREIQHSLLVRLRMLPAQWVIFSYKSLLLRYLLACFGLQLNRHPQEDFLRVVQAFWHICYCCLKLFSLRLLSWSNLELVCLLVESENASFLELLEYACSLNLVLLHLLIELLQWHFVEALQQGQGFFLFKLSNCQIKYALELAAPPYLEISLL